MKTNLLALVVLLAFAIPAQGGDDDPLGIISGLAHDLQIVDPVEHAYLVESCRNTELNQAINNACQPHRRTFMAEHYLYSRGSRATPRLIRIQSEAADKKTFLIYRALSTKAPSDEAVLEIFTLDDPQNVHAVFSWHFEYDRQTKKWRHVGTDDVQEKNGRP